MLECLSSRFLVLLKDLEEFSGRKLKKEAAKRQLLGNEMGDGHNSNEIPRN